MRRLRQGLDAGFVRLLGGDLGSPAEGVDQGAHGDELEVHHAHLGREVDAHGAPAGAIQEPLRHGELHVADGVTGLGAQLGQELGRSAGVARISEGGLKGRGVKEKFVLAV